MEILSLSEVPPNLVEEISKDISDFVIGFVRLHEPEAGDDAELGGSGTLVQIDNTAGILTARHVLVQNQVTLLAMVSRLFPPLIKGGQGGFTGKARHAQRGLLNMH